jgi:hypothetical protein
MARWRRFELVTRFDFCECLVPFARDRKTNSSIECPIFAQLLLNQVAVLLEAIAQTSSPLSQHSAFSHVTATSTSEALAQTRVCHGPAEVSRQNRAGLMNKLGQDANIRQEVEWMNDPPPTYYY